MLPTRLSLTVAFIAFAAGANAQEADRIENLQVTRITPEEVTISFEYAGGACEAVEPAVVGEIDGGTLPVTFTTVSTAEICTMQVKQIEVAQSIDAEHYISRIDITLTAPDGQIMGTATAELDHD
jgi:hypothetical protein